MKTQLLPIRAALFLAVCVALLFPSAARVDAQLFENLKALSPRYPVGDPSLTNADRGPKGIVAADLSGDGLADFAVSDKNGSVTIYVSRGAQGFEPPRYLTVDTKELRSIIAVDVNRDGALDLLTASPFSGTVHVLMNLGGMRFEDKPFYAWMGARDLTVGDFDGDGVPDLAVAGPNMGLRQYQGLGTGQFAVVASFPELDSPACGSDNDNFPQPAFFLQTFRPPNRTRDLLVAAHGEGCDRLWVLASGLDGRLAISSTLTNLDVNALAVGPVLQAREGGAPDLITISLDGGYLEVRRFLAGSLSFENEVALRIAIAGGPRSIKLLDWNRDGWNDLAVLNRFFDRVTLYNNTSGILAAGASSPVGRLPRELDAADVTGDGQIDLVVVNRYSLDVTVIPGFPTGSTFSALDQIYPVDGTVSGLAVRDYNKDGRDDVSQLHIASGELSVRLAQPDGRLADPVFYALGFRPSAQSITDVNNDGQSDIVAVDLSGTISYRLGIADGSFGPEVKLELPVNFRGNLFAIVAADFNGDGKVDLAAGYMDCRIVFMKGDGKGGFSVSGEHDHPLYFTYEARSMAAADFDKDGDLDLVGAGMDGKVSVIENRGDLLTTQTLKIISFESPGLSDVRSVQVLDENQDGDWDLFVAGPLGSALFLGGPGVTFSLSQKESFDAKVGGNSTAMGDFDGDGKLDMAVADGTENTLNVFIRNSSEAPWELAVVTSVPSGMFLATGDLDGDGKADLVGSGDVLWAALSSRRTKSIGAQSGELGRATSSTVVINEFLASNVTLPLELDGGRTSDWVELYNGAAQPVSVVGWSFQLIRKTAPDVFATNRFILPSKAILSEKGRLMLVADDKKRTPLHTNFNLPAEGGILELLDKQGRLVDRIEYPAQEQDQSFCRFRDGASGWVVNPYPSPNRRNLDNGTLDPRVSFEGVDAATLKAGSRLRFSAKGRDDLGITTIALFWRRVDIADPVDHRAILFDDGLNEDGATQDGLFSGRLDSALPPGARIQFYLKATDLTDKSIYLPNKPESSLSVVDSGFYSATIEIVKPTLEISEVVPSNKLGLSDEGGRKPDWVEVHNRGTQSVDLSGFRLSRNPYGGERYKFPNGLSIAAGEYVVVFCDGGRNPGIWHATFELDADGDEIYLMREQDAGLEIIDSARFGALPQDRAWARGRDSLFIQATPTPYAGNVPGLWISVVAGDTVLSLRTQLGEIYQVETSETLTPGSWQTLLAGVVGDGRDRNVRLPATGRRFYRIR